jgi:hypothetical protein
MKQLLRLDERKENKVCHSTGELINARIKNEKEVGASELRKMIVINKS